MVKVTGVGADGIVLGHVDAAIARHDAAKSRIQAFKESSDNLLG